TRTKRLAGARQEVEIRPAGGSGSLLTPTWRCVVLQPSTAGYQTADSQLHSALRRTCRENVAAAGACRPRRRRIVPPDPTGRSVPSRTLTAALLVTLALAPAARGADVKLDTEDQKTLYALGLALSRNLGTFNLTPEELTTVEAGISDGLFSKEKKVDLD